MDIETSEAIVSLRTDVGHVEASIRAEIRRVETSLRAEIGKLGVELRAEMATKTELAAVRDELIRHTDMRFEGLRDDIRLIADGFAFLSAKIDSFCPPAS